MGKENEPTPGNPYLKKPVAQSTVAEPNPQIWHPQFKPRQPMTGEKSPVKKQEEERKEKKQYLEEKLSIQVQSGSVYSYRVRHLEDSLMFSPCKKISKDGKTHEIKHYAYVSYDIVSDENISFRFREINKEQIIEEMTKLFGELKKGNYRGENGRMIYIDNHGKILASPPAKYLPTIIPRYVDASGNLIKPDYSSQPGTKKIVVEKSTATSDTHRLPETQSSAKPETAVLSSYRAPEPRVPASKYEEHRKKPTLPQSYNTPDSKTAAEDVLRKNYGIR